VRRVWNRVFYIHLSEENVKLYILQLKEKSELCPYSMP
jgi:hypothetical protein